MWLEDVTDFHTMQAQVMAAVAGLELVVLILLEFALFRPALARLTKKRNEMLQLLKLIPQEDISVIHRSISDIIAQLDGVTQGVEDDGQSQTQSAHSSSRVNVFNDTVVFSDKTSRIRGKYMVAPRQKYGLVAAGVCVVILLTVTLVLHTPMVYKFDHQDLLAERSISSKEVVNFALTLSFPSCYNSWMTNEEARAEGKHDVAAALAAHQVMLLGGSLNGRDIHGVNDLNIDGSSYIYFSDKCMCRYDDGECDDTRNSASSSGLMTVFTQLIQNATKFFSLSDDRLLAGNDSYIYETLHGMLYTSWNDIDCGSERLIDLYFDATLDDVTRAVNTNLYITMVVLSLVMAIGLCIFYPMIQEMRKEGSITSKLMLLVPMSLVEHVPALSAFLQTGTVVETAATDNELNDIRAQSRTW